MSIYSPGVSLPAAVTGPTAWAAFRLVFASSSWTVVLAADGSDEVDLVYDAVFQSWLDEVGSKWYPEATRGFVSSQILEVCGTLTPARVRQLRLVGDRDVAATSDRLRSYVKEQVRETLHRRFSMEAWEQDVRARTDLLPEKIRVELHQFLGLDQLVDARLCRKGVNYLFKTIEPKVVGVGHEIRFAQTARIVRAHRNERSGDPADLARALALRAGEALLRMMAAEVDDAAGPSIEALVDKFRSLTEEHGSWAMVALVLEEDRENRGLTLPEFDDRSLRELVARQEVLLSQLVTMSDLGPTSTQTSVNRVPRDKASGGVHA